MLETVLLRTFLLLYVTEKSQRAERQAFVLIASVCWDWYHAVVGWPESPTHRWFSHQLKKRIEREYMHFDFLVQMQICLCVINL